MSAPRTGSEADRESAMADVQRHLQHIGVNGMSRQADSNAFAVGYLAGSIASVLATEPGSKQEAEAIAILRSIFSEVRS